ncbi:putative ubiquitin-RnfH superfamily antitoxin RatB of RatAB toxin-antitoxin module [Rhodanobacter sp. TND4EL1]
MGDVTIHVEVVCAGSEHAVLRRIEVARGTTVSQAIDASGIADVLPKGMIDPARLGVFSRKVAPDQVLRDGDRVEIYRPLLLDPMEARRRRAR